MLEEDEGGDELRTKGMEWVGRILMEGKPALRIGNSSDWRSWELGAKLDMHGKGVCSFVQHRT